MCEKVKKPQLPPSDQIKQAVANRQGRFRGSSRAREKKAIRLSSTTNCNLEQSHTLVTQEARWTNREDIKSRRPWGSGWGKHGVLPNRKVRYFTVRESARLQTFPDEFIFHGSWSETMRQLGNAVPVMLAKVV
jgi:site-specific DNA-cytosine methylase